MDFFGTRTLPFLSRRNYYYELKHLLPWGVLAGMIEGNVGAILVAKTFGGGEFLVAAANATPIGALLFCSIWGVLCVGRPKLRLATVFGSMTALMAATICLTPQTKLGGYLFVAQMAAAQVFLSGMVTVRSALWKHNYPPWARGRIAARLQAVRLLVSVCVVTAASFMFDRDPGFFRYAYPAAAVAGLLAIVILQRLHVRHEKTELRALRDKPAGHSGRAVTLRQAFSPSVVIASSVAVIRESPRFAWYLVAQMALGVSVQIVMPVLVIVMSSAVPNYFLIIIIVEVMPKLAMFASLRRWGRLFDRVNVNRFRVFTGSCASAGLLTGLIATVIAVRYAGDPSSVYLNVALGLFAVRGLLHGLHQGGGTLAWNLGHLQYAKRHNAERYMAVHQSLTGVRGIVSPFIGVVLWKWIGWGVWVVALAICLSALAGFYTLARGDDSDHKRS